MRTIVYVDAFNLYYGSLKGTSYRWLNLETLARLLLAADNEITRIKYFTARVSARPNDPGQPNRQQLYLRALGTLPKVEVHYGHYLTHEVSMPLASPVPGSPRHVRVIKTEEKGSDVIARIFQAYPESLAVLGVPGFEVDREAEDYE